MPGSHLPTSLNTFDSFELLSKEAKSCLTEEVPNCSPWVALELFSALSLPVIERESNDELLSLLLESEFEPVPGLEPEFDPEFEFELLLELPWLSCPPPDSFL